MGLRPVFDTSKSTDRRSVSHSPLVLPNQPSSDKLQTMKTLTVTDAARNFSAVMDGVEANQEEIVLVRNRKPIARLVPEPAMQDALEVFGDLCGTLDDETGEALGKAIRDARKGARGTLSELRNPWAS